MIGIYKITNKLNGKSYIEQSIHCGKRLDEHYKGDQFIDEVIQLEGIQNFTFEILKEVNKIELSFWEDYYIQMYNTIFPNGYNKKWNCSEDLRKMMFKTEIDSQKEEEDDEIILCDEDIELLKRANYAQKIAFDKRRICTKKQLKKFYREGKLEAQQRKKIPLDKIVLKEEDHLTSAQNFLYHIVYDSICDFNDGKVLWNLTDVSLEILKDIDLYYEEEWERKIEKDKLMKYIGMPSYTLHNLKFTLNSIEYFVSYERILQLKPWHNLFNKGFLNKERIKFLDAKNKILNIEEITTNKEIKLINRIVIS